MTVKKKPNYFRGGWGLIALGMVMNTALVVLNTALQKARVINNTGTLVHELKIEIAGYALGVPSLMIVCGLILIMHGPLGELISKWRKK